jgi:hypothetical protein
MIKINDLQLNKYKINADIDTSINTLIIASKEIAYDFSKIIAGINKSDITYLDELIYDNDNYARNRIYIDNNIAYLDNLNSKRIENMMIEDYQKVFDSAYFNSLIKKTHLRIDVRRKDKYEFVGKYRSISNDIFALSTYCIRIFYLAFKDLDKNILKDDFIQHKGNIFFTSFEQENIKLYEDIIDDFIVLYEDRCFKINKNDKILKVKKEKDYNHISIIKNLIYENDEYYYVLKEALSDKTLHAKASEINIYDIGK